MRDGIANFEHLETIGRGGYGEVILVRRKGALSCIKRLRPTLAHRGDLEARLVREATWLSSQSHPNIVAYLGAHRVDGEFCFEMAYIRGSNLEKAWSKAVSQGAASAPLAGWLTVSICAGLGVMHNPEGGGPWIHGDICPQNVLISIDGEVKIIDFEGVCRADSSISSHQLNAFHRGYGAPERESGMFGPRTDVFSVGVVLKRMLTQLAGMNSTQNDDSWTDVYKIAETACAVDPQKRYSSAREMHEVLCAYLDSLPTQGSSAVMARVMKDMFS